jgi:hypothetical protein
MALPSGRVFYTGRCPPGCLLRLRDPAKDGDEQGGRGGRGSGNDPPRRDSHTLPPDGSQALNGLPRIKANCICEIEKFDNINGRVTILDFGPGLCEVDHSSSLEAMSGPFASFGTCVRYVRLAGNSGNAGSPLMASRQ